MQVGVRHHIRNHFRSLESDNNTHLEQVREARVYAEAAESTVEVVVQVQGHLQKQNTSTIIPEEHKYNYTRRTQVQLYHRTIN